MQQSARNPFLLPALAFAGVLAASGQAQTPTQIPAQTVQTVTTSYDDAWHRRPYLLALRAQGIVDQSNWWHNDSGMQDYAKAHPDGSYLLFVQDGMLYRLDTPAELTRLAEEHQPLEHLASVQSELAASMAPLSQQQEALGAQMRATHDPAIMGRIGREQGSIGRRQGEIGREQGVIGRQQGVLGRAFYQSTQAAIDHCLLAKSCPAVGPAAPATAQR